MGSIGGGFSPSDKKELIQSINESQEGVRDTLKGEVSGLLEAVRASRKVRFFDRLILGACLVAAGTSVIGVFANIFRK